MKNMLKIYGSSFILLSLIIILAGASAPTKKTSSSPQLIIDYLSTLNGNIDSCGCHDGDYGGIVRRATYIKTLRKNHPNVLVLYNGDLSPGSTIDDQVKADFLFKAIKDMKYDVFNVGEGEFAYGWQYLQEKAKEDPIFISANILDAKTGKSVFPAYQIKSYTVNIDKNTTENINVGVIGVIGRPQWNQAQKFLKADSTRFTFEDPITVLHYLIPRVRQKADLIIVLAHMNTSETNLLPDRVEDMDVLIAGHDVMQTIAKPLLIHNVINVINGDRGRYGGQIEINFDKNKQIASYKGNQVAISDKFADDMEMAKLRTEYKRSLPSEDTTATATE